MDKEFLTYRKSSFRIQTDSRERTSYFEKNGDKCPENTNTAI